MLSDFQLNYVIAIINQVLDLISLNVYDSFINKHFTGFLNYSTLLFIVLPISYRSYKTRKFSLKEIYYIISLVLIQAIDFSRRLYYDIHKIQLHTIKYPDILLRALIPWFLELSYNSKYVPNFYRNLIIIYVGTSVFYSLTEYTFQTELNRITLEVVALDLVKLLLEIFESHFVIELNLNEIFLTIQYMTYSLSELITLNYLYKSNNVNLELNTRDFILSLIFMLCELGCMYLISSFTVKFAKFKEIRLLVFETYFDLFLDAIFKAFNISYILYSGPNLLPRSVVLHLLLYFLTALVYFLNFLLECLTCFTNTGQAFHMSMFNLKISPVIKSDTGLESDKPEYG